jgi:hypothetical protein
VLKYVIWSWSSINHLLINTQIILSLKTILSFYVGQLMLLSALGLCTFEKLDFVRFHSRVQCNFPVILCRSNDPNQVTVFFFVWHLKYIDIRENYWNIFSNICLYSKFISTLPTSRSTCKISLVEDCLEIYWRLARSSSIPAWCMVRIEYNQPPCHLCHLSFWIRMSLHSDKKWRQSPSDRRMRALAYCCWRSVWRRWMTASDVTIATEPGVE